MTQKIIVMGGGTVSHVRNHLALSAPAYGGTARKIAAELKARWWNAEWFGYSTELVLTKMADHKSKIETNDDVAAEISRIIADKDVKIVFFNMALVDYDGRIGFAKSGKLSQRMKTSEGPVSMQIWPAEKLIGRIRKDRKDIFVVGFKTTTDRDASEMYVAGLELLKKNSLNLVLVNDTVNMANLIVVPEEAHYGSGSSRNDALFLLIEMTLNRATNTFTRSTVVPGDLVKWDSKDIPETLRKVVDHCIQQGAYKPFLGKTAGHFAVKTKDGAVLTSVRKTNFNTLEGLVKIEATGADTVIAHGFKPSVGGQSQRIIFNEHPEADCIVHFHCPPTKAAILPIADQWPFECGSHQCGKNTSDHLTEIGLGDGHMLKVVMLDNHGPNIVFNRNVPAEKVINFINDNFNLSEKTGGVFA